MCNYHTQSSQPLKASRWSDHWLCACVLECGGKYSATPLFVRLPGPCRHPANLSITKIVPLQFPLLGERGRVRAIEASASSCVVHLWESHPNARRTSAPAPLAASKPASAGEPGPALRSLRGEAGSAISNCFTLNSQLNLLSTSQNTPPALNFCLAPILPMRYPIVIQMPNSSRFSCHL